MQLVVELLHSFVFWHSKSTLGVSGVGAPASPGDRFWQTLTFSVNLRWFSKVPIRYAYHQLVVRNGTRVVDT